MKKLFSVLVVLMLLVVSGCNANDTKQESLLTGLYDEGYELSSWTLSEGKWNGLFVKYDENRIPTSIQKATINMSTDEENKFNEAFDADDYEQAQKEVLLTCKDVVLEIEDVNEFVPSQEELDSLYIGKTYGQLEELGFDNTGYIEDEDALNFYYDGEKYAIKVSSGSLKTLEEYDNFSPNELKQLIIETVEYAYPSFNCLD